MKIELHEIIHSVKNYLENSFGEKDNCLLIAIGGPGGSGKSIFAQKLAAELKDSTILNLDNYRKPRKERADAGLLGSNPEANNIELLHKHLVLIKNNEEFEYPLYDEVSGEVNKSAICKPAKFNIIEGEITLYKNLLNLFDFSIVIDCGLFNLFMDRIRRDRNSRAYSIGKSIKVLIQSTLKDYKNYYKSNSVKAGLIILRKGSSYKIVKGFL